MFDNQSSINRKYDFIVIGAGVSGLTTSLILAKEGKRVALFERDFDIAPLIRPYKRRNCEFSPGLHISGWMDEGEIISSFLKYLDVSDGVEQKTHQQGLGNVIIGSKEYCFPRGFKNIEKSLISYFPADETVVADYIRMVKEVNDKSFYFNRDLKVNHKKGDFIGSTSLTLLEVLKNNNASDGLVELLGTLNYFLIGSKAEEVPFDVHAFVIGGFYQSPGLFTINGINRLLLNYKRELNRFGVELFLNTEVEELVIDSTRNVHGIVTSKGDKYYSSTVIASFDPKLLLEKIKLDRLRPIYRERLKEAEDTFGLYVVFYEIKEPQNIEIKNYVYNNNDSDFTLAVTTNYSGDNLVLCGLFTDNETKIETNTKVREKIAKEKLELLEKVIFTEIPGLNHLKDKVILLDYLKPWSFERYTKTINGSAYGIKQTINCLGFQHRVPIKGVYIVGQAIYPGFLGSMLSGFSLAMEFINAEDFWSRIINQ